ncbi:hypothetical protein L873DRAFT_1796581 [Choiromyces venosus 120613-1]|uniref:Uncharacterized protein n=1 Tax=Choiromyces venosus 120613-1 TaxID=1336337 RepID=A0A3N4IQX6_9PEZI|nr:hypothetical protein L873DRAFT_1796581 [Choiromyces venosus 120613-1]
MSFIKPHEIKNHSIPKGPKVEGGPIRPWLKSQSGQGSNKGPEGIGQMKGNMNSHTLVPSNGLHENIGSREGDTPLLGYNLETTMIFLPRKIPTDILAVVVLRCPWDKENSKAYPLAPGHTGFQGTVGERASNGFGPWSRPPPPAIQAPLRSLPPPPSESPADGFDPHRWN